MLPMMNAASTPMTQSDEQQRRQFQQALAMGLMQTAAAQNPTTSKNGAMLNGLTQGLAGALGGYMMRKNGMGFGGGNTGAQ